jgi:hypothetical protein
MEDDGLMSLTEIKSQLTSLGISTTTPGAVGEARYQELWNRLNNAKGGLLSQQQAMTKAPDNGLAGCCPISKFASF